MERPGQDQDCISRLWHKPVELGQKALMPGLPRAYGHGRGVNATASRFRCSRTDGVQAIIAKLPRPSDEIKDVCRVPNTKLPKVGSIGMQPSRTLLG